MGRFEAERVVHIGNHRYDGVAVQGEEGDDSEAHRPVRAVLEEHSRQRLSGQGVGDPSSRFMARLQITYLRS